MVLDAVCEVLEAPDGPTAIEAVRSGDVDVCLLDVRLPGMEGIEVLERLKRLDAGLEVVLVTAVRTVRTAVEAMKLGAYDYLTKPFAVDDLRSVVNRALERRALQREVRYLRDELARHEGFDQLVGRSPAMRRVYEIVRQIADTTATVLITGESGTGKELIARAIHRQGNRARPALRGRELRGIARGRSRVGAVRSRAGRVHGRARAEARQVRAGARRDALPGRGRGAPARPAAEAPASPPGTGDRAGRRRPGRPDRRPDRRRYQRGICGRRWRPGRFREDLFYRLHVVPIAVPPLRDRREDVVLLARHFLAKYARQFAKGVTDLSRRSATALDALPLAR